ncbi:MAG: hypothetical protein C5B49_14290 [Bdellovibrio sp.]|nr:MAG: hypothetical protein C5B49_14290 [Bdellovibrio sp.]
MRVLKGLGQLKTFLDQVNCSNGCLADTGFLYGMSYKDDRFYPQALEVSMILEENNIPIHTNVVGRLEFVDLIFRKMITRGVAKLYKFMDPHTQNRTLFNLAKNIRDQEVSARRNRRSYKIGEGKLKEIRRELVAVSGEAGWKAFCTTYVGDILGNEWRILEEDFGLFFIEMIEGQTSDLVPRPLLWNEMVGTMGRFGIRGPDAMILNLFMSSSLSLLITSDNDFNFSEIEDSSLEDKAVLILEESLPDQTYLNELKSEEN